MKIMSSDDCSQENALLLKLAIVITIKYKLLNSMTLLCEN